MVLTASLTASSDTVLKYFFLCEPEAYFLVAQTLYTYVSSFLTQLSGCSMLMMVKCILLIAVESSAATTTTGKIFANALLEHVLRSLDFLWGSGNGNDSIR